MQIKLSLPSVPGICPKTANCQGRLHRYYADPTQETADCQGRLHRY